MKIVNKLIVLTCLLASIYILPAFANPTPATATKQNQSAASLLFVLQAKQGTIAKNGSNYTLTLTGMDRDVLFFSDRPKRISGLIELSNFMAQWSVGANSFAKDHPNGAIMHAALPKNTQGFAPAAIVEIYAPKKTANGWQFTLRDLSKPTDAAHIQTGTYHMVRIFLDDYGICPQVRMGLCGEVW
jgi:hypothetical protein